MNNNLTFETTVRVVLFNSKDEILLQGIRIPNKPQFFITPGGRVEEKEDLCDAVMRELVEETGFSDFVLISERPLFSGYHTMQRSDSQGSHRQVRLLEHFFAARLVGNQDCLDKNRQQLTSEERSVFTGQKWFALSDLNPSEIIFVPINVKEFAEAILYGRDIPEVDFRDPPQFNHANKLM